jgi:hypothetical protein
MPPVVTVNIDMISFHIFNLIGSEDNEEVHTMCSGSGLLYTDEYATIRFSFAKSKFEDKMSLDMSRNTHLWKKTRGDDRQQMLADIKKQCNEIVKEEIGKLIPRLNF